MQRYSRWIGVIVLATIAGVLWLSAQSPKRSGTYYVYILSDDPWRVSTAVTMASVAKSRGYEVIVHLSARGVKLADKRNPNDALAEARQNLQALIREGVKVYVCPRNSARAGMKVPDDWISGVLRGVPETVDIQMRHDTQVVTF
ncbi:MAG: DsrE family protein [Fimbriimonadales bacterium]|nr:DsrE family protein [Fimbriimonadales bacterium]MDW8052231.1 DsrE family protein [Armatimonadota bacterium]